MAFAYVTLTAVALLHIATALRQPGVNTETFWNSQVTASSMTTSSRKLSGTKPNFVVFFADDFGYGDLHSYGHPTQEPGNIDDMANFGIKFTQWYSAESICTPSRMAMMTGRIPTRMGMVHSVFGPSSNEHLPTDDPTVAEMVKPHGYMTGMVGKWHLGINEATKSDGLHLPFYRGFEYVGHILPFSNHWACDESGRHFPKPGQDHKTDVERNNTCFLYHNTTLVQQPIDHTNLTATLVADAKGFINSAVAQKKPFYFYMPFPQCHVSMFTGTPFTNTSENGIFGDQIREMDWAVGQVMDAVKATGQFNNTLFFFSSDHGPHVELCLEGGTAGRLRGGKGDSSWEGGLRVPGIAFWSGTIRPSISEALASTTDIFATILDLAGIPMPTDKVYDGKSLVPILEGKNMSSPHEALFHYCGDTLMAVRYGKWKIRWYTEQLPLDNYSTVHCTHGWAHGEFFQGGWTCHGGSVTTNTIPEFFDIESDHSERYPLLDGSSWNAHLQAMTERVSSDPALAALKQFPFYKEIDAFSRPQPNCNVSRFGIDIGEITAGYAGSSISGDSPQDIIDECASRCCADKNCKAFTVNMHSLNSGEPKGKCTVGKPCCWQSARTTITGNNTNATSGVYQYKPSGPYAPILEAIDKILAEHLAKMKRETIPGGRNDVGPCCGDIPGVCTCNYPGKIIP